MKKYLYLLSLLCSEKIEVPEFESVFVQIRAQDEYWLSGKFDEKIGKVLDTLYLDVRDYSLDYLYDCNDFVNVNLISFNEGEVKSRAEEALKKLKAFK
ncbi:colicin immunity domain-containing protein [Pedobacter panaciterrae]|uniref:colicin immunity domain-containing protein n=1 Tax=Pedobacter panaciterrae TaxID=363849 RepID=UPI0037431D84